MHTRFSVLSSLATGIVMMVLVGMSVDTLQAQVAGQQVLNPVAIPQFVDPLPHFAGLRVDAKAGGDLTVRMVPSQQVAVSTGTLLRGGIVGTTPGVGLANVWVYRIFGGNYPNGTPPLWPGFTIEARRGNPIHTTYINDLYNQRYSDVGLVVDQTLHWANPNDLEMDDEARFDPYYGEPPAVVHLHGGEVPPHSDGGPDAWFTPGNVKTGHAFNPDPYLYPNTQEAATLWFHDHALGATRLNVYAGLAAFYFLRDPNEDALQLPGWSGDGKVKEGMGGFRGVIAYLPEIEMAIQDRMFDTDGKLYFPNDPPNPDEHPTWTPEFVGNVITVNGKTWPVLNVAPRKYRFRILNGSNARFYNMTFPPGGPVITQIGTDGGFLDAPVSLGNGPLLLAPGERADVIIDFTPFDKPKGFKGKWIPREFVLGNDARTPFPEGDPVEPGFTDRIMKFVVDAQMNGPDRSVIPTSLKTNVKLTNFAGAPGGGIVVAKERQLTLNEVMGDDGPLEALVNNTKWSGIFEGTVRGDFAPVPNFEGATDPMDFTYYSETTQEGTTEIWKIINMTGDAHPIHLHLVQFQLMSRQRFDADAYAATYDGLFPGGHFIGGYGPPNDYNVPNADGAIGGNPAITPYLHNGTLTPANPNEKGWKDTFIMYPEEVTTVIARWAPTDKPTTTPATNLWFEFDPSGGHGYVWHCHIIDHEDNEMMRPYNVTPNPNAVRTFAKGNAGQPVASTTPGEFSLGQNYPNPFNPTTEIRFTLPENSRVQLKLYNTVGQEVATVLNADAPAGTHTVKLDASNLASGVYFYQLKAGSFSAMKKMILLR